jgi:hypothetical protein
MYGQTQLTWPSFAAAPLHHASTPALLPRQAVTSLPLLAQALVASTQYMAIKGGHLCISSAPALCPPPVSHHRRTRLCLHRSIDAKPSHPPLSPYVGPGASLSFRPASQIKKATPSPPLSSSAIDRVGEFRPSVARLPRFELGLSTVSGECTVGWRSLWCTPCRELFFMSGECTRNKVIKMCKVQWSHHTEDEAT